MSRGEGCTPGFMWSWMWVAECSLTVFVTMLSTFLLFHRVSALCCAINASSLTRYTAFTLFYISVDTFENFSYKSGGNNVYRSFHFKELHATLPVSNSHASTISQTCSMTFHKMLVNYCNPGTLTQTRTMTPWQLHASASASCRRPKLTSPPPSGADGLPVETEVQLRYNSRYRWIILWLSDL